MNSRNPSPPKKLGLVANNKLFENLRRKDTTANREGVNVFCYGTLEFEEVMHKVTGATFTGDAAVLEDYARYMVKGAPYPAVIHQPGASTSGTVYYGLNAGQVLRLDDYEGSLYQRIQCEVVTNKGQRVTCEVYVLPDSRKHKLSTQEWNKDKFARLYLKSYCNKIE
jgi:gamma-glutamylcyclotransferase (GGCT)/AIG2-like uncharacterized protein YtfP